MNFIKSIAQGQAASRNLRYLRDAIFTWRPPVRTFCFWSLHSWKSNWYQNKSTAIRRQIICNESLIRNLRYWKRSIIYIASVVNILQSCDAGRLVGRFYVTDNSSKRNVFILQSFRCGSHKFIAFKITSQSLRCTDWFALIASLWGIYFNKLQ